MKFSEKRLLILLFFFIILFTVLQSPYFNLGFNLIISSIIFYIVCIITLRLSSKVNFTIGILSILISFPWVLVGARIRVEGLGVIAFVAFLIASLQLAWSLRKEL